MKIEVNRAAQLITIALLVTAVTQMIYVLLEGSGKSHIAYPIWRTEALAALVVALCGFVIFQRHALVGGCLVVCGLFNVMQTGMGLTMFYQLGYGGDAPPNPVFFPVLRMSFFLYYAAKAALGVAAIFLGTGLWQDNTGGIWRILGLLLAASGAAALLLNAAAMAMGLGVIPFAGELGVVAAILTAVTLPHVFTNGHSQDNNLS